ncbi:MAG: hypothetical protein ACMUEM_05530 [Flavobacteriales bacterium AspAUS03]
MKPIPYSGPDQDQHVNLSKVMINDLPKDLNHDKYKLTENEQKYILKGLGNKNLPEKHKVGNLSMLNNVELFLKKQNVDFTPNRKVVKITSWKYTKTTDHR